MYRIVSLISLFLRTYIFENPFERYIELYLQNTIWYSSSSTIAYLFNLTIGGSILCGICFPLVGLVYDRGENPTIGSILYGVFVLINSKILVWVSQVGIEFNLKAFRIRFGFVLILEVIILGGVRYLKEYLRFN